MKTAEQKAVTFMAELEMHPLNIYNIQAIVDLENLIVKLLKEQDRDTRHACANAVGALRISKLEFIGDAVEACMNVKAV